MARLVKTVQDQLISCNVVTEFSDGTSSIKPISVGDIVEGLRYVYNQEVISVTGKVTAIQLSCSKVTPVSKTDPKDNFSTDVKVVSLTIDASKQYESNVVTVDAREIVEDAGVENVERVYVLAVPDVTLEMTYTDGRTIQQDVVVGDVLCDMVIMTQPMKPDIKGDFRVAAFDYSLYNKQLRINGMFLLPLSGGNAIVASFGNIIRFVEEPKQDVTDPTSLGQLAAALAENDEVFAFLETDVTIPPREDGRITTLMINEGKTLTVDLNGHNISTQAYAFYVNGGTLVIRDRTGNGKILASMPNKTYPAVQVNQGGVCTMESGIIDTTGAELGEGDYNWMYGVVCSGDGIFNMTGGQLITQDAAGISITNGTATGEGAQFNIGGDAVITCNDCTAIYLADNKKVNITDNAVINGGILLRLGDLNISGKAKVNSAPAGTEIYPLGRLVCESGCENHNAAILAMTGCYNSALGNDLNITIEGSAEIHGYIDNIIDIATLNTKYDQKVNIVTKSSGLSYVNKLWNIYNHQQLASMAVAEGKTLPAEISTTDLTIKVDGNKVYPE